MNFYKISLFLMACLGVATIAKPMEPFRKKSSVSAKTLINDLLKQKEENKRLICCIAEKRARVAWLQKDIRRTLLAEWYEPVFTEHLIVKPFRFKKSPPRPDFWQRTKKFLSFGHPIL